MLCVLKYIKIYYTHTHIFISTLRDNSYSPKNKLTKPTSTLKSKTDDMHTSYCCRVRIP